jgi:heat shock protein HslJ
MRALFLSAALLFGLTVSATQARDLSGTLTYRARIALPPGTEMLVTVTGPGGQIAVRQDTGTAQVPLAFTVSTPDEDSLTLRAALFSGSRAIWVSDDLTIPMGADDIALGEIRLYAPITLGLSTQVDCGGVTIAMDISDQGARLRAAGPVHDLAPEVTASGTRYADGKTPPTTLWIKGNRARVTLQGTDLPECLPVPPASLLPITLRGNEPGWMATLTRAGITFSSQNGDVLTLPLPTPTPAGDGLTFPTQDFDLTLSPGLCHDTMTGMPYPVRAELQRGADRLAGCGGAPSALLQGTWTALEVMGEPLAKSATVTLHFDAEGVSGLAACNRYSGRLALSGEGIAIGPVASTRMACDRSLMAAEQATFAAFAATRRFDIEPDGTLILFADNAPVLRATR